MVSVKVTNIVKLYTVLLLAEGPRHGYEIIKRVGHQLGKTVSPGEIYPFLRSLKERNFVTVSSRDKREKKIYSLTKDGRKFVKSVIDKFAGVIDIAVEPRITTCAHCECEIYRGGYKEKIKGKMLTFCCKHCAKSFKTH